MERRELAVVTELGSLHQSRFGSITAVVYFRSADLCFPQAGWSDFVVVVLGWWIEAAMHLVKGKRRTAIFRFMEGPLLVRLHSEGELWAFECIEEKLKGTVVEERGHAVPRQVLTSLRDAARATIEACTKKQLYSSDLDTLMRLRDELEELLLAQAVH